MFTSIDSYLWWLTFKWAVRTHRNKPKKWITTRYYGAFNKARPDRWVFGDRDTGAYLTKIAWTPIVRHQMVDGFASRDDPRLRDYWAARKRRRTPPIDRWSRIQLARLAEATPAHWGDRPGFERGRAARRPLPRITPCTWSATLPTLRNTCATWTAESPGPAGTPDGQKRYRS